MARYALVVGVSENLGPLQPLSKTKGDAQAVADILREYGEFEVETLVGRVLKADLEEALRKFLERADRNEAALYYTGHAVAVEEGLGQKKAYFAPSDCRITMTGKSVTAQQNGLPFEALSAAATGSNLSNLIVLLDCCHSEFLLQEALVKESFSGFGKKDYALISACRSSEQAYALRKEEHSLFTGALLTGLAREQAEADGKIKVGGLADFIATRLKGHGQESVFLGYGRSLWLARYGDLDGPAPMAVNEECPYQGLNFFSADTAQWYRGRDRLAEDLLRKVEASAFTPVIGASGSGKSSLVRAGLLPVAAKRGWDILGPILPGGGLLSPADKVADLLLKRFHDPEEEAEAKALLAKGKLGEVAGRLPGEKRLLLVVDQYEELFTRIVAEEERRRFVGFLAGAAADSAGRLRIVATMRADFMDQFLSYRELADLATQDRICWVGPMDETQLRAAIAEPAEINGYGLEPGLLELILRDVEAEPNSLPLLEFALTLLWERRDQERRRLTLGAYGALGGLKGALERHGEAIFNEEGITDQQDAYQRLRLTTEEERRWTRRIFQRLARASPGGKDVRQRQPRPQILELGRSEPDRRAIARALDKFERGRLLVGVEDESHQPYVDLAHEALLDGWPRFAAWRGEDRDLQRLMDRVAEAYREWQAAAADQKDKYLLREVDALQIEAAPALADFLTPEQEAFALASLYRVKPWLDPEFVIETVPIPAGKFRMGSPEGQGYDDERPQHDVSLAAFRLGKYPVTQAQWRVVALSPKVERDLSPNPSFFRGDRLPVEQVSWYDAQEFCARLSRLKGEIYRLPSEAEWEYACRAGQPTAYSFGDDEEQLDDYGWYGNNSGDSPLDAARLWQELNQNANQYYSRLNANGNRTHPVGAKKTSEWGLYDMHGNVWEWCEDHWHDNYDGAPEDGRAWITNGDSGLRVVRGGSWYYFPRSCRSAYRFSSTPGYRIDFIGFRVLCESPRT